MPIIYILKKSKYSAMLPAPKCQSPYIFFIYCRTSMQNTGEDSLLVQKGYEGRIILKDEIVFCEVIDRKIYLNLVSGEVVKKEATFSFSGILPENKAGSTSPSCP